MESTLIWRTKKSSLLPELSDQQPFIHAIKCLLNTFGMFFTTNVFKIPTSAPELCSGTGHLSSVVGWLRYFSGCLTWRSFRGWQSSNPDFIRIKSTKACIPYLSALCSFHQRFLRPHSFCVWRLGKTALQEAGKLSPQTHPSNRRQGEKCNNGHFHYNLIRLCVNYLSSRVLLPLPSFLSCSFLCLLRHDQRLGKSRKRRMQSPQLSLLTHLAKGFGSLE